MDRSVFQDAATKPPRHQSIMWKVGTIVVLILLMLIPLAMISGAIGERRDYQQQVTQEIADNWAGSQTLIGPILVLPYKATQTENINGEKRAVVYQRFLYSLPEQYRIKNDIKPEIRYRGIYKSVVYTTNFTAEGKFALDDLKHFKALPENILWKDAFVVVYVAHTKGIKQLPKLQWNGQSVEILPGVNGVPIVSSGLHAMCPCDPDMHSVSFSLNTVLKGSESFSVVPVGKENFVLMNSDWPTPSFTGNILPSKREVSKTGFKAEWEIPYFTRSYPQTFTVGEDSVAKALTDSTVGVSLYSPIDFYRQSDRAVKYAILFLVLTFAAYFLFEILSKIRIHPFQYILIGFALCLFYLLLLAFAEIVGFDWAYAIASISIVTVISLYSGAIMNKIGKRLQFIITGLLTILYAYLYILLQLEDLSLLFGTIGLLIVLATIMYITRNIDWYSEQLS